MSSKNEIEIELQEHFPPHQLEEVKEAFESYYKQKLWAMCQAILLSRRHTYFETPDPDFEVDIKVSRSTLRIVLRGVPEHKLYFGRLVKQKERQIICGMRDLLFNRLMQHKDDTQEAITRFVFNFVRNAGILNTQDKEDNPLGRIMIQGGHSIPELEVDHHKRMGFVLGLLGLEMVTGSGPGAMEAPFNGALRGYQMNGFQRKFIGITEDGIIVGEPSNDYVDHLIVFPDIEKRLEAFSRMCRGGIIVPGGAGTFEEILTILWIKTHPKNKDIKFPLYFCQPVQSGDYFKRVVAFLNMAFNTDFVEENVFEIFLSDCVDSSDHDFDPKRIAHKMHEDLTKANEHNKRYAEERNVSYTALWNWDLYFPPELQKPLVIDKPFVESLNFSKDMPREELFFTLRSICAVIVETNVRNRNYVKENGPFKLKGDPEILEGLDNLFKYFAANGRMGSREYLCPYVIS